MTSEFPIYIRSMAEPYSDHCKRRALLLLGYFSSVPDALKLELSSGRATLATRALMRAATEVLFREYLGEGNPAQLGDEWKDATGTNYMRDKFRRMQDAASNL